MALYFDPNYADHRVQWKSLGIKHFQDVGPAGDWAEWVSSQEDYVVSAAPEGVKFVQISPQDGQKLSDGPLDKLLLAHDAAVAADAPEKVARGEQQRRETGRSAISNETLSALVGAPFEADMPTGKPFAPSALQARQSQLDDSDTSSDEDASSPE